MKNGNRGSVSQLNSKTSLYCGFTILKLPRKNRTTASAIKLRTQAIITASTLLYQKHAERLTES
nr:hypothetical protein [Klebsiella pneumoniae subsp. pneumoniae]